MAWQAAELEQFSELIWDEIAPQVSVSIRGALERALEKQDGACLTDEERYALANCDGPNCNGANLLALLVAADTLRRDLVGNIVSYVVNRNINFTNICFVGCKFCAFSRGPREACLLYTSFLASADCSISAWRVIAPKCSAPESLIKEVSGMKFKSTRCSGLAKRSLSNGIKLCPPARNFAPPPS